jgi:EAL domain-containing protein (putative c-di-GMP-specific phosphodiesterase class I)/PleD family two-component response regulator
MSYRIVIAEDETDIRTNLMRLLRMEDYEVWAAPNGREALELIHQKQPHLVISDVMMPEMTGHELIQALRADPLIAHIPAVLLTAKADRTDMREGMNLGADDYLTKPFQRSELLDCIKAQLDKAALHQRAEQQLASQAHHLRYFDSVTGLPNRSNVLLLLSQALGASATNGPAMWVVALDNLPQMAQIMGVGLLDDLMRQMAQRLSTLASAADAQHAVRFTVGRLGDDRLSLLVADWPTDQPQNTLALHLLDTMAMPLNMANQEHYPVISVAACSRSHDAERPDAMMARLDMALSAARTRPGQRMVVHDAQVDSNLSASFRLHNDLHRAVERNELAAYFQPQVLASDSSLIGFEALMRWNHPALGLISPVQFIPIAEDNGQIVPMGAWVLYEACRQAVQWQTHLPKGSPALRVAVNLSLRQFSDTHLLHHVRTALKESGLNPEQLELEITESTAMLDLQQTLDVLKQLKAIGLKLAIDDFGTGYSSLAYLKRFPLDVLKVDQSFVRQLCTNREDQAIAAAVINLAHSLGLHVIAEGVETQAQHTLLREMGCDQIQGYLHGKPMPAAEVAQWLSARPDGTLGDLGTAQA